MILLSIFNISQIYSHNSIITCYLLINIYFFFTHLPQIPPYFLSVLDLNSLLHFKHGCLDDSVLILISFPPSKFWGVTLEFKFTFYLLRLSQYVTNSCCFSFGISTFIKSSLVKCLIIWSLLIIKIGGYFDICFSTYPNNYSFLIVICIFTSKTCRSFTFG